MLISLGTLLARTKRAKQLAFSCSVASFDMLEEVLERAEKYRSNLIVSVPSSSSLMTPIIGEIIARHSVTCALQHEVEAGEEALLSLHDYPFPVALKLLDTHPSAEACSAIKQYAYQHHAEVALAIHANQTAGAIEHLVSASGASALVFCHDENEDLSLQQLKELQYAAKLPAILASEHPTPSKIQNVKRAGIVGIDVSQALNHAYTAGLRTGLRDRSISNPSYYLPYAKKAVGNTLEHYLSLVS